MSRTSLPPGWTAEVHRAGYLDWNPTTEKWDIPTPGVWIDFHSPDGRDFGTPIYPPECEEAAWRRAYVSAYLHSTGYWETHQATGRMSHWFDVDVSSSG